MSTLPQLPNLNDAETELRRARKRGDVSGGVEESDGNVPEELPYDFIMEKFGPLLPGLSKLNEEDNPILFGQLRQLDRESVGIVVAFLLRRQRLGVVFLPHSKHVRRMFHWLLGAQEYVDEDMSELKDMLRTLLIQKGGTLFPDSKDSSESKESWRVFWALLLKKRKQFIEAMASPSE